MANPFVSAPRILPNDNARLPDCTSQLSAILTSRHAADDRYRLVDVTRHPPAVRLPRHTASRYRAGTILQPSCPATAESHNTQIPLPDTARKHVVPPSTSENGTISTNKPSESANPATSPPGPTRPAAEHRAPSVKHQAYVSRYQPQAQATCHGSQRIRDQSAKSHGRRTVQKPRAPQSNG